MQTAHFERHLALLYLVVASLWVVISDGLLADSDLATVKGIGFVGVTAAMLYVLLHREMQKRRIVEDVLRREIDAHLHAETQLRASEATFRTLMNAMDDMVYTLDIDQRFTGVYGRWVESPETFIGKTMTDVYGASHERAHQRALVSERIVYEWTRDGVAMQTRLSPILDDEGRVTGVVGVGRDITALKRAHARIRESEERYRAMFEEHQAVMLLIDSRSGAIVEANPAAAAYYGYPLATLTTMTVSQINVLSPEEIAAELAAAVSGQRSYFQFTHRLATGELRQVEVRSGPVQINGVPLLYSIVTDVTEQRQAEDALRTSEERLRTVIQNMPVMLCAFDDAYTIISWNAMSERLTGYTAAEVSNGKATQARIFPPQHSHGDLVSTHHQNPHRGIEWDIICKDGSTRTIAWYNISQAYPVPGWAAWVVGIDVTERVHSQRALEDANYTLEQRVDERTAELLEARAAEHEQRLLAEALRDAATALNSTLNLEKVLDRILSNIGQVMPYDALNIILIDDDRIGRYVRTQGYVERGLPHADEVRVRDVPHFRQMVRTREPLLISETQWSHDPEREWVASYAGAPITIDGDVIGFINIKSVMPGFFNETHLERLKVFTDQVAIAVRNARHYERAGALAALEERQRLARDLHDAVTQTLFSANVVAGTLRRIWQTQPERIETGLDQLTTLTHGALAEMRTLLLELRPGAVADMPVERLFTQLIDAHTNRIPCGVDLVLDGQGDFPAHVKEVFFRIAQEALNNVAQHANANQVRVQIAYAPEVIAMSVHDDGVGFAPDVVSGDHHGLKIMRERATTIGATLDITSHHRQGTIITLNWSTHHG